MALEFLSRLDIALMIMYFVALLIIGYFTSKKQKDEDYLIADRKLNAWSTMMTLNATKTGSILILFTAFVYLWGFSAIWFFIGIISGVFLFIPFALKLKEEDSRYYTLADYFRCNYGKKSAYFASVLTIFFMFGFLVVNLIAGAKIFTFFTGMSFWISSLIIMAIVLTYLVLSGYRAVVKTDVLQYFAIFFIMLILAVLLFSGSLIPASEWNFFSADLITIIGFFIVGLFVPFASPEIWQRVYSAKGKKEVIRGFLGSIVPYGIVAFLLALIALTVKINFPDVNPDVALIHGFANMLPPGILGISLVLLFSAIMSTIDTYAFTAASSIVNDFVKSTRKDMVKRMRIVITLVLILAVITAIAIQDLILGTYIFISLSMVLSVVVLATWIKKSIKQRSLLFGFIIGIMASLVFLIIGIVKGDVSPTIVVVSLIASVIGVVIGGIVSLFKN